MLDGNIIEIEKDELVELKRTLRNPNAAQEVRSIAEKNRTNPKSFDRIAFENLVQDHPIFSKLESSSSLE